MKSQLIEDFLNLPGIAGVALIDGHSKAYVHGLPSGNDAAQQQLTEGIQQILETTPDALESFTFCFQQDLVFLHKVDRGMALLVMATPDLSAAYGKLIAQLTRFMRTDFDAVAAALISVAQPVLILEVGQAIVPAVSPTASTDITVDSVPQSTEPMSGTAPVQTYSTVDRLPNTAQLSPNGQDSLTDIAPATLAELETALNQLSLFTTQYLGKFIVANHWRNHRPNDPWVAQFQVTTTGTISLDERATPESTGVTSSQLGLIQAWVAAFSQRCAKIIRDYPKLARSQALDARQWQLLFGTDP